MSFLLFFWGGDAVNCDRLFNPLFQKEKCIPMPIAALFTIVRRGNNPRAHQQMNGQRCGACAQWSTIQPQKEWRQAIFSNMMGLQIIAPSEASQKEKDKYHVTSFICGI